MRYILLFGLLALLLLGCKPTLQDDLVFHYSTGRMMIDDFYPGCFDDLNDRAFREFMYNSGSGMTIDDLNNYCNKLMEN